MTHGKTYNKSPRRINHKATRSKTNTGSMSAWCWSDCIGSCVHLFIFLWAQPISMNIFTLFTPRAFAFISAYPKSRSECVCVRGVGGVGGGGGWGASIMTGWETGSVGESKPNCISWCIILTTLSLLHLFCLDLMLTYQDCLTEFQTWCSYLQETCFTG